MALAALGILSTPRSRRSARSTCRGSTVVLLVSVLTLVFAFRSSAALAYAFGMAVVGTITITTLLFFYIARTRWGTPLWLVVIGGGALLAVDLIQVEETPSRCRRNRFRGGPAGSIQNRQDLVRTVADHRTHLNASTSPQAICPNAPAD